MEEGRILAPRDAPRSSRRTRVRRGRRRRRRGAAMPRSSPRHRRPRSQPLAPSCLPMAAPPRSPPPTPHRWPAPCFGPEGWDPVCRRHAAPWCAGRDTSWRGPDALARYICACTLYTHLRIQGCKGLISQERNGRVQEEWGGTVARMRRGGGGRGLTQRAVPSPPSLRIKISRFRTGYERAGALEFVKPVKSQTSQKSK